MGRLFVLFFLLPWWAYVPASIGVLWVGERTYEQALATESAKAAALAAPVPEAVDLMDFDRDRDIHVANEVHVTGWIDPGLNYELVREFNGVATGTRDMYMMFGSADPMGAREVRAALMLKRGERAFLLDGENLDGFVVGSTDADEPVFAFNGLAATDDRFGALAAGAIAERGLTMAVNFVFIEPFLEGREAALAPRGLAEPSRYIGWLIAAVVALIGVIKRVRSVRARLAGGAEAEIEPDEVDSFTPPPATAFVVPEGVSEDTPLGRIARRNAQRAAATGAPGGESFDDREPGVREPVQEPDDPAPVARPGPADEPGVAQGRFPPMGEFGDMPAQPVQSSAPAFYVKLLLAMLVVGAMSYDRSLIGPALPAAGVALVLFTLYAIVRNRREGGAPQPVGNDPAPTHEQRLDGAAQPVAVGVGGQRIDLVAPVRGARRERGVI